MALTLHAADEAFRQVMEREWEVIRQRLNQPNLLWEYLRDGRGKQWISWEDATMDERLIVEEGL